MLDPVKVSSEIIEFEILRDTLFFRRCGSQDDGEPKIERLHYKNNCVNQFNS